MQATHFVRANTCVSSAALVPELRLRLASELTPIWEASEAALRQSGVDPPFWAFAWPGGQALARWLLDEPALVRGRRVLDFAAGSGIAALAAGIAGAEHVDAVDIDPLALAAIELNAILNNVNVTAIGEDIVGCPCRWDIILCGDVCYEAPMTRHILPWLRNMATQAEIWIADPGRAYLPDTGLTPIICYRVPTSLELEDRVERQVTLYRLHPAAIESVAT